MPVRYVLAAVCLCALPRLASASECALPDVDGEPAACDRLDYESPYVVDWLGDEPLASPAPAPQIESAAAPCSATPAVSACPAVKPRHVRAAARVRVVRHPQRGGSAPRSAVASIDSAGAAAPSAPAPATRDAREIALAAAAPPPAPPPLIARFDRCASERPPEPAASRLERPPRAA